MVCSGNLKSLIPDGLMKRAMARREFVFLLYENYSGHKLDREMPELLKEF
jgi:hypothetical protein